MFSVSYPFLPKNLSVIQYGKQPDNHNIANNLIHNTASNAPPDDNVGDVIPVALFALTEGNNFPHEVDKINHIVQRLSHNSYISKDNFKIQTINNIPTGIIKL